MSERYDYGPVQTYEIVWRSGHVETVLAHQVTYPQRGVFLTAASGLGLMTEQKGEPQVQFHAEIDGRWRLTLSADEADIRTIRLVTVDEPVPGVRA